MTLDAYDISKCLSYSGRTTKSVKSTIHSIITKTNEVVEPKAKISISRN